MTEKDAKKVISILIQADNGCPYCADDQLDKFKESFPKVAKFVAPEKRKIARTIASYRSQVRSKK